MSTEDQRSYDARAAASRLEELYRLHARLRDELPAEGADNHRRAQQIAEINTLSYVLAMLDVVDAAALVEAAGAERRARYAAAAELAGKPLSEWARDVLDAAAADVLDAEPIHRLRLQPKE